MNPILLAAALILPSFAAAEDWQQVKGLDGIGADFWIDMDSVRKDGGDTHFRTRVMVPDSAGFAYVDSVADCKAKTAEMRHVELVSDGKVVTVKDFEPGAESRTLDDDQGAILMAMICK